MMDKQHCLLKLIGCISLLLIGGIFSDAQPGFAQTPEATTSIITTTETVTLPPAPQATAVPLTQSQPEVAEVTFAQLDQSTFELRSPIDQRTFLFESPYRWALTGGNDYIELHYDMQYETDEPETVPETTNVAISIYFNDTLLTTFIPTEGSDQTFRVPLPPAAFGETGQTQHRLRFVHLSGDCQDYFERAVFIVHDDSFIHFDYQTLPLEINLANFPRPLVQNLFTSEAILLVIPDDYSDADLAAAASVAATLGHRAFYQITLDIITASQATPERLAQTSAVIIGQPKANTFLQTLYQQNLLPTLLTADGSLIANSATQPISPDDGVLQEVVSTFSPDHVYLIVTGTSDAAVTQAARALSVLAPRYGFDGNLVVISEFHEIEAAEGQPVDTFSLADLGFRDTTMYGLQTGSSSARFFVPANWQLTDKPTLTLSYVHSGELQALGSSVTVNLNGKPAGSVALDPTQLGERQAVIELPAADIRPGVNNRLSFEANLNIQLPQCALPELESTWVRLNETSQLRLPHTEKEAENVVASLNNPLTPFAARQDLSDVWFSLSENPKADELMGLVRVAAWLGNLSDGPGFAPRVSQGAIGDTAKLEDYHVIAFGRPTTNPIIAHLNDALPQPFIANEDNLSQQVGNVVYRLPDQFSLGLLQALPAPWNRGKKVMLVATGTTPEGVAWAIETLTNEDTYYQLEGDLAFIRGNRIESFNSAKFIRGPLPAAIEAITAGEEVALQVTPTEITPTTTLSAVLAVNPPDKETQATLPENYIPANPLSSSIMVRGLVFGLIGAGVVVAIIGSTLNQRRARSR